MKNKGWNKGFTLIELLIVLAIVGIIAAVAVPALFAPSSLKEQQMIGDGTMSNGCQGGYVTINGANGSAAQMLDAQGHGIPCN